jgi:hypothetical protein
MEPDNLITLLDAISVINYYSHNTDMGDDVFVEVLQKHYSKNDLRKIAKIIVKMSEKHKFQ